MRLEMERERRGRDDGKKDDGFLLFCLNEKKS